MKTLTYTICLFSVFAMLVNTAHADLVAHWTFDEGTGATAYDSAGTNDGTIYGATWTSGVSGGALQFNHSTTNYVDVPDAPSLRFSQSSAFTISFWANVGAGFMAVSKMRDAGQSGVFGYQISYYGTGVQAWGFTAESSYNGSTGIIAGTNSASPGQWHYVTAVYNNKNMKIYSDGVLENTGTFAYNTGSTTPNGDLGIGARMVDGGPQPGWFFGGSIDDVRIYNEALSGSDITHLYQTTPEPATMALLGLGGLLLRRRRAGL